MIFPYRDEIDLSLTKYGDDWRSSYLVNDPDYTEKMQIFDRWCRRRYELARRQELNEAYKQANDNERRRRREPNEFFDRRMPEILGEEHNRDSIFGDGAVHFTNEGFDPDWMDAELNEHDIPVMEIMKEWLFLNAAVDTRNDREKLEEKIQAECLLEYFEEYEKQERRLLGISDRRQKRSRCYLNPSHRIAANKSKRRLKRLNRR